GWARHDSMFRRGNNTRCGLLRVVHIGDECPILEVPTVDDFTFALNGRRLVTVETTRRDALVRLWDIPRWPRTRSVLCESLLRQLPLFLSAGVPGRPIYRR